MTKLRLAADFAFPLELVTESVAILARRRAGKSNTAKVLVEQLFAAKQQVVVVDPKGDWWGLRSSRDGKGPGLPIIILGGEHADVPLEVGAGELVGRLVVQDQASVVLDTSKFRKHERATFMAAFLETVYRLKAQDQYRTATMLVIDEADQVAPQKPMRGEERMLGAADDIVRLGGQRGLGSVLVSQRAAVLNKNVLTQAAILMLLQTTGSQDLDAVDAWIEKHGQPAERAKVMAALPALPRGTAWVWAPGWPDEHGIFRQVAVRLCETFDSGATPKPGERRIIPKTVADVDLEAFRREMAATIEKAKAEDPRALRQRIQALEAELRKKALHGVQQPIARSVTPKRVEVPILKDAQIKRLEYLLAQTEKILGRFDDWRAALEARAQDLRAAAAEISAVVRAKLLPKPGTIIGPVPRRERPPLSFVDDVPRRATAEPPAEGLTGPQQAILDTVAMLNVRGIAPERESVARWLGIHPNGGSYGTNLGYLRAEGYLAGFALTHRGAHTARAQTTGLDAALAALDGEPKRAILRTLLDAGQPLSREDLAAKLGLHPNGGSYGTNLGWLRTMGLITARGPIAMTEALLR